MVNDKPARSKSDMITQIKLRWRVLESFREQLNILEEFFYLPENEDLQILHVNFIRDGYKWLKAIYETEFAEFHRIWKLIPAKQWQSYKDMPDMDDLQEVILLKKAKFNLRAKLVSRNRSDFFKKGKLHGQIKKRLKEIKK